MDMDAQAKHIRSLLEFKTWAEGILKRIEGMLSEFDQTNAPAEADPLPQAEDDAGLNKVDDDANSEAKEEPAEQSETVADDATAEVAPQTEPQPDA